MDFEIVQHHATLFHVLDAAGSCLNYSRKKKIKLRKITRHAALLTPEHSTSHSFAYIRPCQCTAHRKQVANGTGARLKLAAHYTEDNEKRKKGTGRVH